MNQEMLMKYGGYGGFKAKLDFVIKRTAMDFVQIGKMLKEARDTDILEASGYSGMGEFAEKEYGLRPDQTSRFIGIYEKFGDADGNLLPQFEEHGLTKLSEMLTLPDAVANAIPADLSKEEIREIKAEVQEEQKITPLEVAMEGKAGNDTIYEMVKAYFHGYPELYRSCRKAWEHPDGRSAKDTILDMLMPSGVGILESRPQGMGKILLTFKGTEQDPALTQIRAEKTESITWDDLYATISYVLIGRDSPEENWEAVYGEPMPEEETKEPAPEAKVKIAPAQPEPKEEKTEKTPDSPNAEPNLMPEPEEHEEPQLRGTQDDRDCIKVIKDKTGFLEMLLKDVKRLKPEEEAWSIEDLMEKVESAGQELQAALIDFASVRRKETEK